MRVCGVHRVLGVALLGMACALSACNQSETASTTPPAASPPPAVPTPSDVPQAPAETPASPETPAAPTETPTTIPPETPPPPVVDQPVAVPPGNPAPISPVDAAVPPREEPLSTPLEPPAPTVTLDTDADGVADTADNCPVLANPAQEDSDLDAAGDACDADDDNDSVADAVDNCALLANPAQTNTDGDAAGNACDADDDGDGVADVADNCPLLANATQVDADADGVGDPCDADRDGDGVSDGKDNCPLLSNAAQTDGDQDGQGDACDLDNDNDGTPDATDNCAALANPGQQDLDGDFQGDACDADDDGDGVADAADNCPIVGNAAQEDSDGDGAGNACDQDNDGDGVADGTDNCPTMSNAAQTNTDSDTTGDACDADDDNDDHTDAADCAPTDATAHTSVTEYADPDGDAVRTDATAQTLCGTGAVTSGFTTTTTGPDNCPTVANADQLNTDADAQGDACDADDDGDGVADASDAFPLDGAEAVDTDGDGVGNKSDTDDDGDGTADATDAFPLDAAESVDTDGDGVGNTADTDDDNDDHADTADCAPTDATAHTSVTEYADPDGDAVRTDATAQTLCGTGAVSPGFTTKANGPDNCPTTANAEQLNTDADAQGDACDADDDNDGTADATDAFPLDAAESVDTDGDGVGNTVDADDDGDSTADATDAFPLDATESIDTDGDGVGNKADTDDDNDDHADAADCAPTDAAAHTSVTQFADPDGDEVRTDATAQTICGTDVVTPGFTTTTTGPDNCPTTANADQLDADGDGAGDACDADVDGDGVADATDNCPSVANGDQLNADADGQGDVCDPDDDSDTVLDMMDNCPLLANAAQTNTDGDAQGDACDADDDNDTHADAADCAPTDAAAHTNVTEYADPDGDAVRSDATAQTICGTDVVTPGFTTTTTGPDNCPQVANADQLDADGDSVGDRCDNCAALANADQADDNGNFFGNACDLPLNTDYAAAAGQLPADSCAAWTRNDTGTGTGMTLETLADGSLALANYVLPGDPHTKATLSYTHAGLALPARLTIEAKLRVNPNTGDMNSFRRNPLVRLQVGTQPAQSLMVGPDGLIVLASGTNMVGDKLIYRDTTLASHVYRLEIDTTACQPGGVQCPVKAYYDGQLLITGATTVGAGPHADDVSVTWGHADPSASGASTWDYVHHNAGPDFDQDALTDSCDLDRDGDGVPNDTDADNDNDGTPDTTDCAPTDATAHTNVTEYADPDGDAVRSDATAQTLCGTGTVTPGFTTQANGPDNCSAVANADQLDTDNDGSGDACDADDDNDGSADTADTCPTLANPAQEDADADGQGDACDEDDDNDGVMDITDNCPLVASPSLTDTDHDTQGDACDDDDDGDAAPDTADNCPLEANAAQTDTDSDSQGDACDTDDDSDAVSDTTDNCPTVANEAQTDTDADGQGDACDPDADGDSVLDITDNCPLLANAAQTNTDGDAQGDACDADDDNDTVADAADCAPTDAASHTTTTQFPDADADGVRETTAASSACTAGAAQSGFTLAANGPDNCPTTANPTQADADTDGIGDACDTPEPPPEPDPEPIACVPPDDVPLVDSDHDGTDDTCDDDRDGDGQPNAADNCPDEPNADQADSDPTTPTGNACDNKIDGILSGIVHHAISGGNAIGTPEQTRIGGVRSLALVTGSFGQVLYAANGGPQLYRVVLDAHGDMVSLTKVPAAPPSGAIAAIATFPDQQALLLVMTQTPQGKPGIGRLALDAAGMPQGLATVLQYSATLPDGSPGTQDVLFDATTHRFGNTLNPAIAPDPSAPDALYAYIPHIGGTTGTSSDQSGMVCLHLQVDGNVISPPTQMAPIEHLYAYSAAVRDKVGAAGPERYLYYQSASWQNAKIYAQRVNGCQTVGSVQAMVPNPPASPHGLVISSDSKDLYAWEQTHDPATTAPLGSAVVHLPLQPYGAPTVIAGDLQEFGWTDGDPLLAARFRRPFGLALDDQASPSRLYLADSENHTIKRLDLAPDGHVTNLVGRNPLPSKRQDPLVAYSPGLASTVPDAQGRQYVFLPTYEAQTLHYLIRDLQGRVHASQRLLGKFYTQGYMMDSVFNADTLRFKRPHSVAVSQPVSAEPNALPKFFVYVSEQSNNGYPRIRCERVQADAEGQLTAIGETIVGESTVAKLTYPEGLVLSPLSATGSQYLYVRDGPDIKFRRVDPNTCAPTAPIYAPFQVVTGATIPGTSRGGLAFAQVGEQWYLYFTTISSPSTNGAGYKLYRLPLDPTTGNLASGGSVEHLAGSGQAAVTSGAPLSAGIGDVYGLSFAPDQRTLYLTTWAQRAILKLPMGSDGKPNGNVEIVLKAPPGTYRVDHAPWTTPQSFTWTGKALALPLADGGVSLWFSDYSSNSLLELR